jgi:hypothetical protein
LRLARMKELQEGCEKKTMRRKLPVSETFCRFPAQMSGGNLLFCPAVIPVFGRNVV